MLPTTVVIIVILTVLGRLSGGENGYTAGESYAVHDFAMGTSISAEVYGAAASDTAHAIVEQIKKADREYLSWRDSGSELAYINSNYQPGEALELGDKLSSVLEQSIDICKATDGALDITIRPLANAWGIEAAGEDYSLPAEEDIEDALSHVDYRRLSLEENMLTIKEAGMTIDLGAVGKGYVLDEARQLLEESGAEGATVSAGGSVLVYGSKRDSSPWKVGIRNPKGGMDSMLGYVEIGAGESMCISTSGDYEKYVVVDNVIYHHILDGRTGKPADSGLSSVTVVCENGLLSDGLSTACYVLGMEKAMRILKEYNAEAVFVDSENNITVTDGLVFHATGSIESTKKR